MTPTENKISIHNLIEKRWSPRAFSDTTVEQEQLETLFEAARWAPSAMNEQPWRFIYATKEDAEAYERLLSCLVEANQVWAKNAPVLFLSVAKTTYDFNGNANKHAWHDVGMATANLVLQATELDLHVHLMGGFSADTAREVLGIPEGFEPVSMGAVGYVGDPETLPEQLKTRELAPRQRKPLSQIAFNGNWEQK
ncbi:nitroreductase family protein [Pontibacter cellulosilyticus]|uniref:Nitroreductase family protein n=1 Tax=Pontibacter cellulosilyticus TaxID=1720253 RepID=A0A923N8Z5_9BACT|nr:nitroreductase family protein [Pontibacter cellulosilyticus]MBC5995023.1 nitroreductase family protein [Pontibacter cellulosilyticus]